MVRLYEIITVDFLNKPYLYLSTNFEDKYIKQQFSLNCLEIVDSNKINPLLSLPK
jgi:hypothetical protein